MLDSYRIRMTTLGGHAGEARRRNAQNIMDASWMRDPATKPVYVKWVDSGLPMINDDDIPVYAKYNVKSYHNITGDEIAYLLQFRLEDMRTNPDIKVGSYVQILNEMDEPEWWLIVHYDDRLQFRQFSILKCTWTYKWVSIIGGQRIILQCLGAPRKQNSYNSGVWLDYTTQTVENQEVLWLPTNNDTKTIAYDTKFLKSTPGRYPPIRWTITKIEDTATDGISKFTLAQDQFDPAKDNVDLMIANYYSPTYMEPEVEKPTITNNLEIVYSGTPTVRAGGGYKKLTLMERNGEELVDATGVTWTPSFLEDDFLDKLDIHYPDEEKQEKSNVLKVKCLPFYDLVGKTFVITASNDLGSKSVTVEVIGL